MLKKLWKKYTALPVVVKASLWFMFSSMVHKCMALITTPIFTRIMDTDQYGLYSTYLSVVTIITVLVTLNFDTCAYMNGISKFEDEKEKDKLASSLLSLTILITIVVGLVTVVMDDVLSSWLALPKEILYVMLAEVLFIPPVKFWMVQQRFAYKYVSQVAVNLGMLVLNSILGVIFILYIPGEQAMLRVLSVFLVQAAAGLVFYVDYFRKTGFTQLTKYWRYGLNLNLPLIPHGLSLMLLSTSDRVMINFMIGSAEAGIYGVAYSAGQIINSIKLSLVDALRPWIYEKLKKREYAEIKGISSMVFFMNVMLTFLVVGMAPEIIGILAPKEYVEAVYVIPPVAASSYFTFIYNICSIVELYYERNKRVMVASVVASVVNIVLNFLMIPVFGFLAAGYTTLISYIVLSIMHFIFLEKIRKEEMEHYAVIDLKFIFPMSLAVLGGMLVFTYLYRYTLIRLLLVALLGVCCLAMRGRFMAVMQTIKNAKKKGKAI